MRERIEIGERENGRRREEMRLRREKSREEMEEGSDRGHPMERERSRE